MTPDEQRDRPRAATQQPELDAATIEGVCQRDRAACRAFVRRYQGPVGQLLRRLLGPRGLDHLTEDLAQETMLRAVRALPRFDPAGAASLSTWVLTIATRLGLNELERRRPATTSVDAALEALPGRRGPEAPLLRQALADAIVSAVRTLPSDHHAAFVLREYHGLDYAEIAQTLELSLGTVKSRLSRARATLREALAEVHANHREPIDHG